MKQSSNNWRNEQTDEFYHELDTNTSHKSCCTCQTLTILFVFFLIAVTGTIFYLYWQITRGGVLHLPSSQIANVQDFNQKLQNPTVSGSQATLILTADEFNAALNDGLSIDNFILKDVNLSINPKEFLIYGALVKPLSSKVVLTCTTQAKNDKIKLNVEKITAGNINLPKYFNQKVAESLNSIMDQKMANFYEKYTVEEVNLDQNKIIIIGRKK